MKEVVMPQTASLGDDEEAPGFEPYLVKTTSEYY
jgi:hypothetical protein